MDRLTRHELKTDHFAEEVGHTVEWLGLHRRHVLLYGGIALAVIVLGSVGYYWNQSRRAIRQTELADVLRVMSAHVGTAPNEAYRVFPTIEEKNQAVTKSLSEFAARHSGSMEGEIATYLLGTHSIDRGDMSTAEKSLRLVADTGRIEFANLARLTLAELYASQGKTAEAEKLLRSAIAQPSVTVSSEAATISLARILKDSKPEETRKLLDPLRTGTSAASRQAVALLGALPEPPAAKK